MFNVTIDLIISFMEAICCQMFFDVFKDEDSERNEKIVNICIITILGLLYFGMGRVLASHFLIKEGIVIAASATIMILLYRFELKKAAILAGLFQGLLVAMQYLAYVFIQIIVSDPRNDIDAWGDLSMFIVIIDMLLAFLCVIFIRRMFRGYKNKMLYDEEWLKFIVFPIFTIITIATFISSFNSIDELRQIRMLYVISIGLIAMNFFVFYLLEDIVKKGEASREREIFELQGKEQLEMYHALCDNFEKQRAENHEFQNHIMCIRSLVENGEYKSLKEYIKDISKPGQGVVNVIDTNNAIINAIINTKYYEAISKHIVFVLRINDLSGLKVSDRDLVVLLSNLLNNAIEACEKCDSNRIIKLKFMQEDDNFILSVKNTFSHPLIRQGDDFLTTKNYEQGSHGIGIRNIKKVVHKYNGTYVIKNYENEFYFSIMFSQ